MRSRGFGDNSSLSRGPRRPLLPNLAETPFTASQKASLDARARLVDTTPAYINPDLSFFNPPADNSPFRVTPLTGNLNSPAVSYPPLGGGQVSVISFLVPVGVMCVIRALSIVHIGGNPPDFTGQVIWRVVRNGAGIRGLNNLTAQIGTFAAPLPVVLVGVENDLFTVTVEVPALLPDGSANLQPPAGSGTAASFDGWTYPLKQSISAGS